MMRGINHQNIFEEQEDYYQFLNTLDMMAQSYEPDGTPSGRNYILYAYIRIVRCSLYVTLALF